MNRKEMTDEDGEKQETDRNGDVEVREKRGKR